MTRTKIGLAIPVLFIFFLFLTNPSTPITAYVAVIGSFLFGSAAGKLGFA